MKDRNIEDIDQLFREGLNPEEAPISIPEGEWEKMLLRLKQFDRRKRGIIWMVRLGSVAALILVFFALGILITDNVPPLDEQAMIKPNDQTLNTNRTLTMDSLQAAGKATEQLRIQEQHKEHLQEVSSPPQAKKGQKSRLVITDQPDLNRNQRLRDLQKGRREEIASNKPLPTDTLQKENTAVETTTEEPVVIAKDQNPLHRETSAPVNEKSLHKEEPLLAAVEEPANLPMIEHQPPKIALSVMAAPAYNGVNNLNNGSMGGDFGLLISLGIARNWSFSTGGIYAKKLYETAFRDYNPKNNIWHEYYPQRVNADCRVLDIPLNLSYTLLKAKARTVSIGTGLSSYIMLREDYRFTYAETNPETPLAYRVVNENRHWLSVVNFQASFEQRLSKRISVSLQPYMKIPLTDIGFAGVKLQSMGMAANLNWNFSL